VDKKEIWGKRTVHFNTCGFFSKSISFPQETLHLFAKPLHSLWN